MIFIEKIDKIPLRDLGRNTIWWKSTCACLGAIWIAFSAISCATKPTENQPLTPSNLSGETLAHSYCGSCHAFPEPNLLDKNTWKKGILPKMYQRLGLEKDLFTLYAGLSPQEIQNAAAAGIYPEKPMLAIEDWEKIVKYYLTNAPDLPLPQDKKIPVSTHFNGFKLKKLFAKHNDIPAITTVKFDPNEKNIYLAYRGIDNFIKKYDLNLNELDSIPVASPIADLKISKSSLKVLEMGIMDPNDQQKGSFFNINSNKKTTTILDSLSRPVHIEIVDLNQDKTDDYLICNFGNEIGKLTWINGKTKRENILNDQPGARIAYVRDMNNDKLPDIVTLMTQAKEQVIIYYNIGNGHFSEKIVLNFPPVYGSSFIDLADFNKDGFLDLLYSNGDNADLSISLKKYHGIRIFLNDGKDNFKQSFFYPMFGAAKAVAGDFDLDGNMDIAAISFFPDPSQIPNEGFILFKNTGKGLTFNPSTFKEAKLGKWMVMDVCDADSDGDLDIIIGSFSKEGMHLQNTATRNRQPLAIFLENKIR